jgi:hypothetical protein
MLFSLLGPSGDHFIMQIFTGCGLKILRVLGEFFAIF